MLFYIWLNTSAHEDDAMHVDDSNLIWIDLEMTGLEPQQDLIIEIATVVTNSDLDILGQGPVVAISQTAAVMESMDEWTTRHHGSSGLTDRVVQSAFNVREAEQQTLQFLRRYVAAGKSRMCGNSI